MGHGVDCVQLHFVALPAADIGVRARVLRGAACSPSDSGKTIIFRANDVMCIKLALNSTNAHNNADAGCLVSKILCTIEATANWSLMSASNDIYHWSNGASLFITARCTSA